MATTPVINETEMEIFYNDNPEFKNYVDRYAKKHQIDAKMALQHLLVKYAYIEYKKKGDVKTEAPAIKQEKIFEDDKAC